MTYFLMRSLGRPNRDQIVASRPSELTTLEAIDLSNHESLARMIEAGAKQWAANYAESPRELTEDLFVAALSRPPTEAELQTVLESLGDQPTVQAVEDLMWAVFVTPEFMMVR